MKQSKNKPKNPIETRGLMYDEKGSPITALVEGGPKDMEYVHLDHEWMLGRHNVEIDGHAYKLLCGRHGFFMVWIGKIERPEPENDSAKA